MQESPDCATLLAEGAAALNVRPPGAPTHADEEIVSEYTLREAVADGPVFLNFYLFDFHTLHGEHL